MLRTCTKCNFFVGQLCDSDRVSVTISRLCWEQRCFDALVYFELLSRHRLLLSVFILFIFCGTACAFRTKSGWALVPWVPTFDVPMFRNAKPLWKRVRARRGNRRLIERAVTLLFCCLSFHWLIAFNGHIDTKWHSAPSLMFPLLCLSCHFSCFSLPFCLCLYSVFQSFSSHTT